LAKVGKMFNPLLSDFTSLKDNELDAKLGELIKKYTIAARMGNGALAMQVNMVIESLRYEIVRRQQELAKKIMDKNQDLDKLIKIG
jgi:hypothetical protein